MNDAFCCTSKALGREALRVWSVLAMYLKLRNDAHRRDSIRLIKSTPRMAVAINRIGRPRRHGAQRGAGRQPGSNEHILR